MFIMFFDSIILSIAVPCQTSQRSLGFRIGFIAILSVLVTTLVPMDFTAASKRLLKTVFSEAFFVYFVICKIAVRSPLHKTSRLQKISSGVQFHH